MAERGIADLVTAFDLRPFRDAFWRRVRRDPDGCWLWIGAITSLGYGKFYVGRIRGRSCTIRAHRMSWILAHGENPGGLLVCHRCDNPRCVNPDHLFLGDQVANMADMRAKGRSKRCGRWKGGRG
jgi:hypothetical protein